MSWRKGLARPDRTKGEPPAGEEAPEEDREALIARVRALLERELEVAVVVGERTIEAESLVNYSVGSIIRFPDATTQCLELRVQGVTVAHGTAVVVGERLALRIDSIPSVTEILERIREGADEPAPGRWRIVPEE